MAADHGAGPDLDLEQDDRFPSGPWKGFFLQPVLPGRHWMELALTFRRGVLRGEGRDWVGAFLFRGRYEVGSGKCWWTKQYIGRHSIAYTGYNEGKGIWGIWEWSHTPPWRGGFHIWPVAMGDPTGQTLAEAMDEPVPIDSEMLEVSAAGLEESPAGSAALRPSSFRDRSGRARGAGRPVVGVGDVARRLSGGSACRRARTRRWPPHRPTPGRSA